MESIVSLDVAFNKLREEGELFSNLAVELFETEGKLYAFDANQVQFIEVDSLTHKLLDLLRKRKYGLDELFAELPNESRSDIEEAYQEIVDTQAQGFLLPSNFQRTPKHENRLYRETLSTSMAGICVSITTQCNLSCSYCIFGGQYDQHPELTQKSMTWETMQRTMDFLKSHSTKSSRIRVDFFGGEPLMAFDLIERGIEYLRSIIPPEGPVITPTITTNGTILSERIIDFLIKNQAYIQFSIDGGIKIHDLNRTFKSSGKGSLDLILSNLARLYERDPQFFESNVRMKAVITLGTLEEDLSEFLQRHPIDILKKNNSISFLEEEPHYDVKLDSQYFERMVHVREKLFMLRNAATVDDLIAPLNSQERSQFWLTYGSFFDSQATNKVYRDGQDVLPYTKGCLMGYESGNVTPDGRITICNKSQSFTIGDVHKGDWDYNTIEALNTKLHDWEGCSGCFAQRMCDLCHEKLDAENYIESRFAYCEFTRNRYRMIYSDMLTVLNHNPMLWNAVDQMILKKVNEKDLA
jgi:uncharacterized protein